MDEKEQRKQLMRRLEDLLEELDLDTIAAVIAFVEEIA